MRQELSGETLSRLARFGRIYLLDSVTSTNDYCFTLASQNEPAVVVARTQTRGRGRFRRQWFATEESLTFSVLLFAEETASWLAGLTQFAGLALSRAIERVAGIKPLLRWPNDILFQGKKLAGILCESKRAKAHRAVVIGVGVNVNQTMFPEELPEAGSLRMATGVEHDRFQLLETFLEELFAILERLQRGDVGPLVSEVKDRSAVLHRRVEIRGFLRRHVGTVIDLDAEGRLLLRTDSGRLILLHAGQVTRLR
ncbi:MAG: biotin--[acetyl-CoA-carboxylase] ligase [candidate division WOR-3 bacterium]